MKKQDLKHAGMLVMLLLLVLTAPRWLFNAPERHSSYSAPWVYPALEPETAR